MGCAMATAKRRRRQAKMGWPNLPKQHRPRYPTHSSETWDRIAAKSRDRRQAMADRKSRKSRG
jgi:hypothetical protein